MKITETEIEFIRKNILVNERNYFYLIPVNTIVLNINEKKKKLSI